MGGVALWASQRLARVRLAATRDARMRAPPTRALVARLRAAAVSCSTSRRSSAAPWMAWSLSRTRRSRRCSSCCGEGAGGHRLVVSALPTDALAPARPRPPPATPTHPLAPHAICHLQREARAGAAAAVCIGKQAGRPRAKAGVKGGWVRVCAWRRREGDQGRLPRVAPPVCSSPPIATSPQCHPAHPPPRPCR